MIAVTWDAKNKMYREEEGARKWVVVVAAFFVQFIICGITYSLGIFHHVFQQVFEHDHFDTSWAGSILLYVTAITSVVMRCFMKSFGCRISVMLGGVLSATGLALGMVVTDLYQVYLTYGVLTGIGFGLACTPSIMIVEQHFYEGRFEALSVVLGGVGAGMITFPIIIRTMLEYMAWRGTLWMLAGCALNICVCGALMKPAKNAKEMQLMPQLSCVPLRNVIFLGMCIANLFWSFGSTIIYMYLPSYSLEQGTDFGLSSFLIACVGMSSFTSRMIFAFMGNNSTLDDMTSLLCSVGLGVVVTGICPMLFDDFAGQIGYTLLFGFYSGYWTTFLSQSARELVGPEYIAMGNGYLSFMIALGSLMGGPAAGLLVQEENEFKYVFYLAGSCLLWSSIIMMLFKYQKCGYLTMGSEREDRHSHEQKVPLVDMLDDNKDKGINLNEKAVFVHENGEANGKP
ncbi:monocarboxylate transporter 12-like isoform X1 [Mizuhopecten yessoensis]|uniref:monocarboxylate transporter 12-like isoform X1 n=2 Tax=Mizuhopecten yessoensis TaxID=6573 RepID=UPI000B458C1C|nr:monocarboxylate transporter 12-like isoform X1 [Mizuhopecten yessoensis]XP_021349827.1 monocarboxylate transporter 12-like isoform X1 [Mizuhopecten yessoensis]XP_021349828.1 monocarboxylate transporter 12-like isoform X1 [Mizuhopecten yessoensis]XP_021349829.1 monocarboxylate transporter 12-like isoform X1 [Mizuhopecten yessoensis]XP_021349830.1 monocarboxylate transporter 12-like isoform X1 [Mizuhopecten yessoensis]XP_021349831.1 monocarboxylate transporter 12-like isoform X1 [Mizuhopecten